MLRSGRNIEAIKVHHPGPGRHEVLKKKVTTRPGAEEKHVRLQPLKIWQVPGNTGTEEKDSTFKNPRFLLRVISSPVKDIL